MNSIVFGNVPAAALLAYGMYFISILATMIIAISSGAHGLALFDNDFLQPPVPTNLYRDERIQIIGDDGSFVEAAVWKIVLNSRRRG